MADRKNHPSPALRIAPWLLGVSFLWAQLPDASVRGVVTDVEGKPLAGARVTAHNSETGLAKTADTDTQGRYLLGSVPVGVYHLQVELVEYQGVKKQGIRLAVAAKVEENFALNPRSALPAEGEVDELIFKGVPPGKVLPVETIASSVSVVVDESNILLLPLANRNIYSLFLLQPGVTSQGGIVRRGLSFTVHGQRVSGSNYILDGVDNNNTILTGPVAAASAEAIREFRMVNSSFSAESGRATAFVAHVATRAGANRFHGSLFEFLANDKLDANTFANNADGEPRLPVRHNQFGYSAGGPIQKNKRFFTSTLEFSRLRYRTAKEFRVPSSLFIARLPEDSVARRLLTEIPPIPSVPTARNDNIGTATYSVPNRIDTVLATKRLDQNLAGGKDRLVIRYTLASTAEQTGDLRGFGGYPSLRPTDRFRAYNTLLGWTHSFDAGVVYDFKVGWSRERIRLPRPRADVPILQSAGDAVLLPGSQRQLDQHENNNVVQASYLASMHRGRSAVTAGFEYRHNLSNRLTLGLENEALGGFGRFFDGIFQFPDLRAFGGGQPLVFGLAVDRFSSGRLRLPELQRKYRSGDFAGFIQDDVKMSRRFSWNLGLRYEYFGVPHHIDRSRDVNFYFGPGSTIEERLANGGLRSTDQNPGDLKGRLYRRDRLNFAPSIGLAWDLTGRSRTILRAGYAVALDRVFDTIRDLSSNNQQVVACAPPCRPPFLIPAERMLPLLSQNLPSTSVVHLDENLRTPYAQNWFVGVQQTVTRHFLVEVGHAGSVGRKLISRDVINRSVTGVLRPLNPRITDDTFLSNAGNSNYLGLEVGLKRRFSRGLQYQVSYTYSHAIDNQSDIFEGVRIGPGREDLTLATFTRQFDARVDRGNANFDQRQNLVFNAIWDLPAPSFQARWPGWLLGRWTAGVIGAYRSGFPVTVIGSTRTSAAPGFRNNRVDFLGSPDASRQAVPGGVQWLDRAAFRPAVDHLGNLGRGALGGPGFWNYDFAFMRNIGPKESGVRAQFRAEFYNLFNHANLSAPITDYQQPDFGRAYYGRNRTFSRFGDLPLGNPARRIQFALRLQF